MTGKLILVTLAAVLVSGTLALGAATPEIKLPADAEVVTIVGQGFRLQIDQLTVIKNEWKEVAEESAQVENPRRPEGEDTPVVDENLFEEVKRDNGEKDYGLLEADLHTWIETRATALTDRIDRFEDEISSLTEQAKRVVVQILLMNTLVDLDNLTKENIRSLKWIKNKLKTKGQYRAAYEKEVAEFADALIFDNIKTEKKVKGTNNPGEHWLTNTQAIKRIMHEQRFSDLVNQAIVKFLGGKFSMMERSRVYDLYKPDKRLKDGLEYFRAVGRVPPHFPFPSQDAIIHGMAQ